MDALIRLYPAFAASVPLIGAYLAHGLRERALAERPYIYSNFVQSLDGRISQLDPRTGRTRPPPAVTHPRDWRLYLELAAQADAVLTSGRRLRQLGADDDVPLHCVHETAEGDLARWRRERGLPPHPACMVLTASLDLPLDALRRRAHSRIVVVTCARPEAHAIRAVEAAGAEVVTVPGERVTGVDVCRAARERGFSTLYSIGGPQVLHTLAAAGLLDRLYVSFALRLIGGKGFDTLLSGDALAPPCSFALHELYLDPPASDRPSYLYASLDRSAT
jgi:riboflavin biosynthesis pyrimidine reductase